MDMKELMETLCVSDLKKDGKLPVIYMPNEIFEDMRNHVKGNSLLVASVYACYFLDCLLYRYAIFGLNHNTLYVPTKKMILGFPEKSTVIDPVIKKGGILNSMGYTRPESNFPVHWSLSKEDLFYELHFGLFKDRMIDEDGTDYGSYFPDKVIKSISNRTKISFPIKAFDRIHIDSNGEESDWGTFYSISQTHGIEVETFLKCMANKELGVEGFYLYAVIKHMSDYFGGYWNIKFDKLKELSGLRSTKFKEVLQTLRQYRMIEVKNMPWIKDRPTYVKTKANGYRANQSRFFSGVKVHVDEPIRIDWETCQKEYMYAIVDPQNVEGLEYDYEENELPLPF